MMIEHINKLELYNWVAAAVDNENIKNFQVEIIGKSEKGEGYATDVVFVKVNGSEKTNGKSVELDLVLKIGKDFKLFENSFDEAYSREMFLYDRVFPEYRQFQRSKKQQNIFYPGAKCIRTLNLDRKIIVFENLRKQGYEPHDREVPMNVHHIKAVLKNYALFHAIGFAYRDQKKTEFDDLTKNYSSMYNILTQEAFRPLFQHGAMKTYNVLKEVDEKLAEKLNALIQQGVPDLLTELFNITVEESTITHGDCWSSNFLFKYENGIKACPAKVAILDWQISSYLSPLIDVSYFMFIVSSKEEVAQFDNLLDYYYQNISKNISDLGSDPNKLFPRTKFLEQWKVFCKVGFLFASSFLDVVLCDKDDAPNLENCQNTEDLLKLSMNTTAKNKGLFLERILALSEYYFYLCKE